MTTPARSLATACALYGRPAVALAAAHLAHSPHASIRGAGHRLLVERAGTMSRVGRAELRALCAAIPAHVEGCTCCYALYRAALADRAREGALHDDFALLGTLEPGECLD